MGAFSLFILNLLFIPAAALFLLVFLLSPRRALLKNLLNEQPQRFVADKPPQLPPGAIWLHAASVGEARALALLAKELRTALPGKPILVTCSTTAGKKAADSLSPDAATLAPLDFYPLTALFIKKYRPSALFIMERDLWPNMITAAHAAGLPVCVLNGRMSRRSAGRYALIRFFISHIFSKITSVCAQTEEDARRYKALGLAPEKISVTGNIKYDLLERKPAAAATLAKVFASFAPQGSKVLVCGSTHPVEEALLSSTCKTIREAVPGFKLVIAPRHLERIEQTENLLTDAGIKTVRLSRANSAEASDAGCLLIDTMGQLSACYTFASLCFIGGTIAVKGGHNMLEAAILGKPLLTGPNYYNTPEVAEKLLEEGGAFRVSAPDFAETTARLLSDPEKLRQASGNALNSAETFTGATAKTLPVIKQALNAESSK